MSIFGDSIDYNKVKIHNREYLIFGLQPDNTAMTPNGEIYFNHTRFCNDFSAEKISLTMWFIHEMVHVWQYQLGYPVMLRGAIRIGLDYKYTLSHEKSLNDYNMEAQGNLLADYWALKKYGSGMEPDALYEEKHFNDIALFERVLSNFIVNPGDKKNLPG